MKRKIRTIKNRAAANTSFTLSRKCDDGEVLEQSFHNNHRYHSEYVVQSSITDIPFEEYIILKEPDPGRYPATSTTPLSYHQSNEASDVKAKEVNADKQKKVENVTPPSKSPGDQFGKGKDSADKKQVATEVEDIGPDDFDIDLGPDEYDSFEKDMKSILNGEKAINDKLKAAENRFAQLQPPTEQPKEKPQALDQFSSQHAIFDQIAQSMEYAKAYDLGSIDLEKRFADFDAMNESKKRSAEENKKSVAPPMNLAGSDEFDHEEFIRDLSIIKNPSVRNAAVEIKPENKSYSPGETNAARDDHYVYESASTVMSHPMTQYSYQQNPAILGGIAVADAIQIGLGAASIVQAQVSSTQGGFSLSCDYAQRLLTNEARQKMKGAQKPKQTYRQELFWVGELKKGFADASIVIEWEGNSYGEIGTAVIRRDILHSTEWTKSTANITVKKIDRIPLPGTDPRTWPLVYTYEGTFDPYGNGYFEFSGEFEINAFGGLKYVRHEVVNRSFLEFAKIGKAEEYVRRGKDVVAQVPEIPQEQLDYLKSALP